MDSSARQVERAWLIRARISVLQVALANEIVGLSAEEQREVKEGVRAILGDMRKDLFKMANSLDKES